MGDKKILILEDEEGIRDVFGLLLSVLPVQITMTGRVADALEAINKEAFDLFISDLRLPDGRGVEAINHFRQNGKGAVIVVTGAPDFKDQYEVELHLTGIEVISKPFDMDLLMQKIEAILA